MTSNLINITIRKNILGVGKKGTVVWFPPIFSELVDFISQVYSKAESIVLRAPTLGFRSRSG